MGGRATTHYILVILAKARIQKSLYLLNNVFPKIFPFRVLFMLIDPAYEIVCDANIQGAVTFVCQDIDVEGFFHDARIVFYILQSSRRMT